MHVIYSVLELDEVGDLEEVIVGPDVKFLGVVDKRQYIVLDLMDVGNGKDFFESLQEIFLGDILSVELQDTLLEMREI